MNRFAIHDGKLQLIQERCAAFGLHAEQVRDFIQADWPNAAEHQEWLNSATSQEIASWVRAGLPIAQ